MNGPPHWHESGGVGLVASPSRADNNAVVARSARTIIRYSYRASENKLNIDLTKRRSSVDSKSKPSTHQQHHCTFTSVCQHQDNIKHLRFHNQYTKHIFSTREKNFKLVQMRSIAHRQKRIRCQMMSAPHTTPTLRWPRTRNRLNCQKL